MLDAARSLLVFVDFQARLMPAIDGGEAILREAARLAGAARSVGVPVIATEQNPAGLGGTVAPLAALASQLWTKTSFDACHAPGFVEQFAGERRQAVVAGCEAHVCVLQTVLGLRSRGVEVAVVADAVGSRRPASKAAALERMARHGVEIVTAEMAIFEWLADARHPRFREVLALVK